MSYQRPSQIMTISVSSELAEQISRISREEQKTKSELLRDAFRQYTVRNRLTKIFRYGAKTAIKLGIETYDDVEKIGG